MAKFTDDELRDLITPLVRPENQPYEAVQAPGPQPAANAPTAPQVAAPAVSVAVPEPVKANTATPVELPTPLQQKTDADSGELKRLQDTGSGITQLTRHPGFFHKLGGVAARIGDIAGSALFPSVMAQIPGTELHHQELEGRQEHRVNQDLGQQEQEQKIATEKQNAELVPVTDSQGNSFHIPRSQLTAWQTKTNSTQQKGEASQRRFTENLTKAGMKLDDDGQIAPMSEEELPVGLRGDLALKKVREDYYSALSDLAKSKNDPNSPAFKLANQKLQVARQNATAAAQRAAAYELNATSGALGTAPDGTPLPGAMLDENGTPIGAKFSQNVRPTGQQRGKANLAQSADEQLNDMKDIVQKRPDIFGPAAGRTTDFTIWAGSQDPDAQKFRAARTIAGDHLAGVFGGRSEAALDALDAAIGHYKDNPAAIISGLDQLSKANKSFIKAGVYRTVGDRKGDRTPATRTTEAAVEEYTRDPNTGKLVKK